MGSAQPPAACMFVVAAFSRHPGALAWARQRIEAEWSPVVVEGAEFAFTQTTYYETTMGGDLRKVLWGLRPGASPEALVERKLAANRWEAEYAAATEHDEPRPLNLDPGYLTEAKLVLATTKDRDHRIYLERGILAEVTLAYRGNRWASNPWTYPDYQTQEVQEFLLSCRAHLRSCRGSC